MPLSTDDSFSSPVAIADLDGNQDLEIILGDDNGNVHVLHYDGPLMNSLETDSETFNGVSIADIDGDGSMELLFSGDEGYLHAWDPITNEEANGWPIDLGSPVIDEPITMDIDNDGDQEIMCVTESNEIHFYHHDGVSFENFPYISYHSIYSMPVVGDIDNDGDFEVIIGTSSDLRVIDIAQEAGGKYTWSTYRSSNHRNGYFDVTLASTSSNDISIPTKYSLGNNYPNPFNPITRISYGLPKDSNVNITVYDINGRVVNLLINSNQPAGQGSIIWNGKNDAGMSVAAGLYFYKMQAGTFHQTNKMILLK